MPVISPPASKHKLEDTGQTLRLVLPSRKHVLPLVIFPIWLIGWCLATALASLPFIADPSRGFPDPFLAVWLILWIAGEAYACLTLLWQVAGKEIIEASYQSISLRRDMFGVGRISTYLAEHIRDLRATTHSVPYSPFARLTYGWSLGHGTLAFDHGARTVRFGATLEEAEAKAIIEAIGQRFPQYGKRPDGRDR